MKLTTKSEYSILALIHLARHKGDELVKMEGICTKYGIPKKYLEQLLFILKRSGYVRARRGAEGGYCLAKSPGAITLAEVIRLMDGALAPTESVSEYFFSHTPLEKEAKVIGVLTEIRDYVSERLEATTLADLV
ncbi:MAG: Rrf2 family transcriptional regulator [Verrucomicrobia bacterium]|nr:Rrf2 family transcriptional regulator [Verrucomicrobiota bacterium]